MGSIDVVSFYALQNNIPECLQDILCCNVHRYGYQEYFKIIVSLNLYAQSLQIKLHLWLTRLLSLSEFATAETEVLC